MRWLAVAMVVAVAPMLHADDPKADEVKKELKKFEGTWVLIDGEGNGNKFTEEDRDKLPKVVVEGARWTLRDQTSIYEGTMTLDPGKDPRWIDVKFTSGSGHFNKGDSFKGIYKFFDDELILCFRTESNQERPKEFTGKQGSQQVILIWKRKLN